MRVTETRGAASFPVGIIVGFVIGLVLTVALAAKAAGYDLYSLPPSPAFSGALSVDCATSGASKVTAPASGTYWLETRSDQVSICSSGACPSGGSWKVSGFVAEISMRQGEEISCRSPSGAGAMQITRSMRGTK